MWFPDFFLLTHETHAHSIKPTYPGYEPQILGGDEEVAQESIPILSRQLVRAETGHQRNDHKTVADAYHALGSHFERVGARLAQYSNASSNYVLGLGDCNFEHS